MNNIDDKEKVDLKEIANSLSKAFRIHLISLKLVFLIERLQKENRNLIKRMVELKQDNTKLENTVAELKAENSSLQAAIDKSKSPTKSEQA